MMAEIIVSGETVETSGQYVQVAKNGRVMNKRKEATLVKGEPAPPTDREGWRWKMVDATRHLTPGPSPSPAEAGSGEGGTAGGAPAGPYQGRANRMAEQCDDGDEEGAS